MINHTRLVDTSPCWSSPEVIPAVVTATDAVENVRPSESETTFICKFGITGGFVLRVTVMFKPLVVWIVAPVVISTYNILLKIWDYITFSYDETESWLQTYGRCSWSHLKIKPLDKHCRCHHILHRNCRVSVILPIVTEQMTILRAVRPLGASAAEQPIFIFSKKKKNEITDTKKPRRWNMKNKEGFNTNRTHIGG
jgi:hypothetical protein